MRKRRQHQQLVTACEAHVMKIDELIKIVEMACAEDDVGAVFAEGVATVKRFRSEFAAVAHVHELMDERAGAAETQRDLSEDFAGAGDAADVAEALAELAKFEEAIARESGG